MSMNTEQSAVVIGGASGIGWGHVMKLVESQ
jgi:NAD(P)-dependent dehydrogenase (short-subunit alcohol dehydrogenase family)